MYDAKRFVLNNRAIFETAPLQLYCSALVFSPQTCRIRRQFLDQIPPWIKNIPTVQKDWSSMLQSLDGHSDMVRAVAFTPDGKLLASASCDGTARLWDPSTGALRGILEGHSYNVAAAFSPDVLLLATGYDDGTVELWETSTGSSRGTLEGHDSFARAVAFSPDGQLLASASNDGTVRLWGVLTRAAHGTPSCHRRVSALAFSPNGQLLASASKDGMVKLWNSSTGAACRTLQGDWSDFIAVAFSPVSQLLACASENKVRLWDPSTGDSHDIHMNNDEFDFVEALAFSLDGLLLASAGFDNRIRLWDPSTGAARGTLEGHCDSILAMAFSPDGQLLASASGDKTVRIWDLLKVVSSDSVNGQIYVSAVAFSPDGQLLASASVDGIFRFWDPLTGASRGNPESCYSDTTAITFSPDGQLLAYISDAEDGIVDILDLSTGASHVIFQKNYSPTSAIAFSPDGPLLADTSDGIVRLWDLSTGAACGTLEGHSDRIRAMAFSPDGQLLASASHDNTVRLWDIKTKKTIEKLDTKTPLGRLSFLSNCSYLSTSQGILEFKRLTNCESRSQSNSRSFPLHVRGNWVMVGEENILWLPPNCRPTSLSVRDNILAMGLGSGEVVFVVFDPGTTPLGESFVPDSQQGV